MEQLGETQEMEGLLDYSWGTGGNAAGRKGENRDNGATIGNPGNGGTFGTYSWGTGGTQAAGKK